MKKLLVILFITTLFASCKDDAKTADVVEDKQVKSEVIELSGTFIYYADAAVFQTKNALFGVIENKKAQELIKKADTLKNEAANGVEVTLKVRVVKKQEHEEGWENKIDIIEIIDVSKAEQQDSDIIKLRSEE